MPDAPPAPPGPTLHLDDTEIGRLAGDLMRRQARLAVGVAAGFLVLMFGLPLANVLLPEEMQARVAGFPFSWLLLGLLLYPLTWVLAAYFVRRSEWLEQDDARLVRERGQGAR